MEKKTPISASDLAAILAIWAVAYIGCKNAVSSALETHLPQYFSDLLKPDSPTFGISTPVQHCIFATMFTGLLLFFCYDIFIKKIDAYASSIRIKFNIRYIDEIVMILFFILAAAIDQLFNKDTSLAVLLFLIFYVYSSKRFLFAAKLAIVPSLLLIFFAFLLPPTKSKNNDPYMISTTCEGLKDIKALSATKVGNFVEIKTETGLLLINMNTITQIRPIETSPEEAAKTKQPAAQK